MNALGREAALVHCFFRKDPDELSDEEYAKLRARMLVWFEIFGKHMVKP